MGNQQIEDARTQIETVEHDIGRQHEGDEDEPEGWHKCLGTGRPLSRLVRRR